MLLHGEFRREAGRLADRLGHHVAEDQRAVRDPPLALSLFKPVKVSGRRSDPPVGEALRQLAES